MRPWIVTFSSLNQRACIQMSGPDQLARTLVEGPHREQRCAESARGGSNNCFAYGRVHGTDGPSEGAPLLPGHPRCCPGALPGIWAIKKVAASPAGISGIPVHWDKCNSEVRSGRRRWRPARTCCDYETAIQVCIFSSLECDRSSRFLPRLPYEPSGTTPFYETQR